ncbi:MAG: SCO family protein [Proteobacteria bacterium]|nr:SCO family protein [Pseudomonadota bacterium]
MNHARNNTAFVLIAIALIGGGWLFMRATTGPAARPEYATVLPSPMVLPDFTLNDQNGSTFTRESLKGSWSLLFFGFTHCPDICPATLQSLAVAREKLAAQGQPAATLPKIILISVDPERDSTEVLKSYVSYFGKDIIGLTGDLSELQKLTKPLGIFFAKSPADDGGYNVDHSAAVLVINPSAEFHALFSPPHSVANLLHDLPLILVVQKGYIDGPPASR